MELNKMILDRINNTMNYQTGKNDRPLRWFYCFGTLLEYVDKQTFNLDFDIDIGVIYGECDANGLIKAFEGIGYKEDGMVLHDVDKDILNVHFRPISGSFKGTPTIDVYFWIKKNNIWYHTYDVNREGKKILKKYIFKGVEERINIDMSFFPRKKTIDRIHSTIIEGDQILTDWGVWSYDIFGDHSEYKFYCPYAYGYLTDIWYGGSLNRQYYKGQSMSPWRREVKSCKNL